MNIYLIVQSTLAQGQVIYRIQIPLLPTKGYFCPKGSGPVAVLLPWDTRSVAGHGGLSDSGHRGLLVIDDELRKDLSWNKAPIVLEASCLACGLTEALFLHGHWLPVNKAGSTPAENMSTAPPGPHPAACPSSLLFPKFVPRLSLLESLYRLDGDPASLWYQNSPIRKVFIQQPGAIIDDGQNTCKPLFDCEFFSGESSPAAHSPVGMLLSLFPLRLYPQGEGTQRPMPH